MDNYDVIIAGAGPAGAQCARYIAENSDYSVILLDRTHKLGYPKKSTAGTFRELIDTFKLPESIIMDRISSLIFESPTNRTKIKTEAYVLDFGKLKKYLANEAVSNGVSLKLKAIVKEPLLESNQIVGVKYYDENGEHTIHGRIIIDATGPSAALSQRMGLYHPNIKNHWVGMEYEMSGLSLEHQHSMLFRFDQRYAAGGYSWIFSTGINQAKVGIGWCEKLHKAQNGKGSLRTCLNKLISDDIRLKKGRIIEVHGGDANFKSQIWRMSTDNFMTIGDSICCIDTFFSEGIRQAMFSGLFAAQVAIKSLKLNDTSALQLKAYEKLWNNKYPRGYRLLNYFMSKLFYRMSNARFDKLITKLNKMDQDAVDRFIRYRYTLKDVIRILPFF